ncbi:hypothetical protein PILCRDRAFT_10799 [Piloderma croceum F 1598]|uniref:Uncharacterized protein n=1 Tax=Piloderma croceum (strain F 1598) TaxID=765440 RepID=A0A0C3BNF5_PILCF|nr:hypothetical protein PILCRDRAFT_10799 [Piloderma croceum F 1598]
MLRKVLEALGVIQPQDSFPYYQTSGAPPGNMYANLPTMQPSAFTHMYPPPPNRVEHVPDPRARFEAHPTTLYLPHGPHTFLQYTSPPYPIGPVYANRGPPLPSSGAQPGPQVIQGHPYSQNWTTDPQGSLVPTTTPEVMHKDPREALIEFAEY